MSGLLENVRLVMLKGGDAVQYINSYWEKYPDDIHNHFPEDGYSTWNLLEKCIAANNSVLFKFILEGSHPLFHPMKRDCHIEGIVNGILRYGNLKFIEIYSDFLKDKWILLVQNFIHTHPYVILKPEISEYLNSINIKHTFFNKVGFWKPKHIPKFYEDVSFDVPKPQTSKVSQDIIDLIKKHEEDNPCYVDHYFGWSYCRLCDNDRNGDKEYYFVKNDVGYVWPEGYLHYLIEHNVHPPQDFIEFLKK